MQSKTKKSKTKAPAEPLPARAIAVAVAADVQKHTLDSVEATLRTIQNDMQLLEKQIQHNLPDASAAVHIAAMKRLQEAVDDCFSTKLFSCRDLERHQTLVEQIEMTQARLSLFQREIETQDENVMCLHVYKQPYCNVHVQKSKKGEPFALKLLVGARVQDPPTIKQVKALVKHNASKKIELAEATIPFPEGNFCFSKTTKKTIVRLAFESVATDEDDDIPVVVSNLTRPFVVITNENQFGEAWSMLFMQMLFESDESTPARSAGEEVPWLYFCNLLQLNYLMATRQPLNAVVKMLQTSDFDFIKRFHVPRVDKDESTEFFKWFAKVINLLRYNKPVFEAWTKGYIVGFISKEQTETCLKDKAVGTFVVRFSNQNAGQLAISWVDRPRSCSHHLVPATPIKNISEYIMEKQSLIKVVCIPGKHEAPVAKEDAFGKLLEKKQQQQKRQKTEGYEDLE